MKPHNPSKAAQIEMDSRKYESKIPSLRAAIGLERPVHRVPNMEFRRGFVIAALFSAAFWLAIIYLIASAGCTPMDAVVIGSNALLLVP